MTDRAREGAAAMIDGVLTGYMTLAIGIDADGDNVWSWEIDPDMSVFTAMGLAVLAKHLLDQHVDNQLEEDDQ